MSIKIAHTSSILRKQPHWHLLFYLWFYKSIKIKCILCQVGNRMGLLESGSRYLWKVACGKLSESTYHHHHYNLWMWYLHCFCDLHLDKTLYLKRTNFDFQNAFLMTLFSRATTTMALSLPSTTRPGPYLIIFFMKFYHLLSFIKMVIYTLSFAPREEAPLQHQDGIKPTAYHHMSQSCQRTCSGTGAS